MKREALEKVDVIAGQLDIFQSALDCLENEKLEKVQFFYANKETTRAVQQEFIEPLKETLKKSLEKKIAELKAEIKAELESLLQTL